MQITNQSAAPFQPDLSAALLPETTIREAGSGPTLQLPDPRSDVLSLTLRIMRSIEQESLRVSIWGSADGVDWGTDPLLNLPRKFYCGTYTAALDLTDRPEIRFLRAAWKVKRWSQGDQVPVFTVCLQLAPAGTEACARCA